MRLSSFILASGILAQGVFASTTACNADNCARAVTGTRTGKMPDVSSRMADCSSFMKVTVTPATTTFTATVTITVVPGGAKRGLDERQMTVVPSGVPVYASACSGTARYRSACSCWGITASTITVATPSTTKTVTATVTACPAGLSQCGSSCKNLLTDPNNCGTCSTTCPSGICSNGACSSPGCTGETCSTFTTCGAGGSCVCASTSSGTGFCVDGSTGCGGLPSCNLDSDCASGSVCAIGTCCGVNVCIGATFCGGVTARDLFRAVPRNWVNATIDTPAIWVGK